MRSRRATALVPLLIACGVTAGCSSGGPVHKVTLAINCGMVVDQDLTGYFHRPLTVGRAVAALTRAERDGGAARIDKGTLSSTDRNILDTMAVELMGYSGNRLSAEAEAFAQAELDYSPPGLPVDTTYAPAMERAIAALSQDCPATPAPSVPHSEADSLGSISHRDRTQRPASAPQRHRERELRSR